MNGGRSIHNWGGLEHTLRYTEPFLVFAYAERVANMNETTYFVGLNFGISTMSTVDVRGSSDTLLTRAQSIKLYYL